MTHQNEGEPASAKRTRDPRSTRERLVRAALELFTTEGYHASTTPVLASRAGVAEGTIYRHFTSKEQLLNEIFRAAVRMFAAAVPDSDTAVPCRQRLDQIATAWREIAKTNPHLIKLVFVLDLNGLLDDQSQAALASLMDAIETVMVAGKSTGQLRAGSARIWTDVWLRLVVLMLERTANAEWPQDHPAQQQVLSSAWDAISAATP